MSEQACDARASGEAGATLVEVLVTVAIISIVLVVFITALSTGTMGVRVSSRLTTATNLAAVQLESIKAEAYDAGASYGIVETPVGYGILLAPNIISARLQQITVTVTYDGETLVELSDYKVDR